jgi:predicted lipoprotein with Yx(FWY)xxD motif
MATIATSKNPQLGAILTDSQGNTVYVFAKDSSGALAAKLGTTKRSDGSTQVTYGGRPLYTYTGDSSPGDVTGNGLDLYGAKWYAVQPNGSNAPAGNTSNGASSTGGSTSGGGYGY